MPWPISAAPRRSPIVTTQLGYQRTNHVDEFGFLTPDGGFQRDLSGRARQLPCAHRAAVADLHGRAAAGARARGARRGGVQRPGARQRRERICGSRSRVRSGPLLTARESARVLEEAVRRVDAQLADVRARFDAGLVPPNDVLSVEAQRARQQVVAHRGEEPGGGRPRRISRGSSARPTALPSRSTRCSSRPERRRSADPAALLTEARAGRTERAAPARSGRALPRNGRRPHARGGCLPCRSSPASTTHGRTRASFHAWTSGATRGTSA